METRITIEDIKQCLSYEGNKHLRGTTKNSGE